MEKIKTITVDGETYSISTPVLEYYISEGRLWSNGYQNSTYTTFIDAIKADETVRIDAFMLDAKRLHTKFYNNAYKYQESTDLSNAFVEIYAMGHTYKFMPSDNGGIKAQVDPE